MLIIDDTSYKLGYKRRRGRPKKNPYTLLPGETFDQMLSRVNAELSTPPKPKRGPGRPRKPDKFSMRYGYIPGRCNAYCKPYGSGKLCRQYPMRDKKRCAKHGGRGLRGGWRTGRTAWKFKDTPDK